MKCPFCGGECESGKAVFSTIQGFGNMLISFTSEENARKGFFKRKTEDKIILFGEEFAAAHCRRCNKVITALETD